MASRGLARLRWRLVLGGQRCTHPVQVGREAFARQATCSTREADRLYLVAFYVATSTIDASSQCIRSPRPSPIPLGSLRPLLAIRGDSGIG